ncbi:MAG TPA: ribosome small subunit-dependent GTPase A [Thermoanaerobaculia bacterium]|nr:ribosome small subunit-dependent GTPase A [Thermoanaerobaculia bacterium]
MEPSLLVSYGLTPEIESFFETRRAEGLVLARVLSENRDVWEVATESGVVPAEAFGRLYHAAASREELPAVGDWVAVRLLDGEERAFIDEVLPRRTLLARKEAGRGSGRAVLAANVDTLFVVTGLDHDLNTNRIQRYAALAADGGVVPVVVLTKADLARDPEEGSTALAAVRSALPGVEVHAVSSITGAGVERLTPYLGSGKTVALAGSSGAGKSTLVNALLGVERLETSPVRESDSRGRHTTTRRQAFLVPTGALVVDTPGLREVAVAVDESALDTAFGDVAALASRCRFRDCRHKGEPGCAVREALERGELDPGRLEALAKLRREAAFLADRAGESASHVEKKRFKRMIASAISTNLGKKSRR